MSAFATLALENNAAATVNFYPLTIDTQTGVASYGTNETIFDAKNIVTLSSKVPGAKSTRARFKAKVTVPIMDAVDTTKKVDEIIVNFEFSIPRNATSAMRLDSRAYAGALIDHAVLTAYLTSFEGIY